MRRGRSDGCHGGAREASHALEGWYGVVSESGLRRLADLRTNQEHESHIYIARDFKDRAIDSRVRKNGSIDGDFVALVQPTGGTMRLQVPHET